MKLHWKDQGVIFRVEKNSLPYEFVGYCQAPQCLVLKDRIRIYFSSRRLDNQNLFLSQPFYVDFDLYDLRKLSKVKGPVLELGRVGTFDEHGIFPLSIFKDEELVYGFTTGWFRRPSVGADSYIGITVSHDQGLTFKRSFEGPIIGPTALEPYLLADPSILKVDGQYLMWYVFGTSWFINPENKLPYRTYKISMASSKDMINWNRSGHQIISDGPMDASECQAMPSVVRFENMYHMVFCVRNTLDFKQNKLNTYRLAYAYSYDGSNWIRCDEALGISRPDSGWCSEMMCYPNLVEINGKLNLFYNGNEFGKFAIGHMILDGIKYDY